MRKYLLIAAAAGLMTAGTGTALASHPQPGPGPNGRNDFGLCRAYQANENGRAHGRAGQAPPFVALVQHAEDASDDDNTGDAAVAEFCSSAAPGGNATGR